MILSGWSEGRIYTDIERPLPPILLAMQKHGVLVDIDRLHDLGYKIDGEIKELRAGVLGGLNPASPKQVGEELLRLGFEIKKRTATGKISTDEETLRGLLTSADGGGKVFIEGLLLDRGLSKLRGTYVDGLLSRLGEDGRIHGELLQTGAETGRFSSRNPNLQNITSGNADSSDNIAEGIAAYGLEVRKCFVASPGMLWLKGDYSQVEYRVMAAVSRDAALVDAYVRDSDIHTLVLSELGWPASKRRQVKVVNFGVSYGMGPGTLSQELSKVGEPVSRKEAEAFLQQYWRKFPGLAAWFRNTRTEAAVRGYVETMFGRRDYAHLERYQGRENEDWWVAKRLRELANQPIQGTAADLNKMWMRDLYPTTLRNNAYMLLTVHDEQDLEWPEDTIEQGARMLQEVGERVYDIGVPLKVEVGYGKNWGDLH